MHLTNLQSLYLTIAFAVGLLYALTGLWVILLVDRRAGSAIDRLDHRSPLRATVVWLLWPLSVPLALLLEALLGRRQSPARL